MEVQENFENQAFSAPSHHREDNVQTDNETRDWMRESYRQYQQAGGIINEKEYARVVEQAKDVPVKNASSVAQAEFIAKHAGVELDRAKGKIDHRVVLYMILREDTNPGEQHHHSQMCDQRLFAEALRIAGDIESLDRMREAYPNISFD